MLRAGIWNLDRCIETLDHGNGATAPLPCGGLGVRPGFQGYCAVWTPLGPVRGLSLGLGHLISERSIKTVLSLKLRQLICHERVHRALPLRTGLALTRLRAYLREDGFCPSRAGVQFRWPYTIPRELALCKPWFAYLAPTCTYRSSGIYVPLRLRWSRHF